MSTLQTLLNFIGNNLSLILGIIIIILLIVNSTLRHDLKIIKKESFKLVNFDINSELQVSFCKRYDVEVNIPIFIANITNALKCSQWNPENKSPDDPDLINLQMVLLSYGYQNVIFKSLETQKHPMGVGMNAT